MRRGRSSNESTGSQAHKLQRRRIRRNSLEPISSVIIIGVHRPLIPIARRAIESNADDVDDVCPPPRLDIVISAPIRGCHRDQLNARRAIKRPMMHRRVSSALASRSHRHQIAIKSHTSSRAPRRAPLAERASLRGFDSSEASGLRASRLRGCQAASRPKAAPT